MATFEEVKQVVSDTAEAAKDKAVQFTEKADDWARKPHPEMEKAAEAVGSAADGAIDKMAQGADAVYSAFKNKVEEISGMDVDDDGLVGNTGAAPGEVKAGVEVAAEAVTGAAGKVADVAKGAFERLTKKDVDGDGEIG